MNIVLFKDGTDDMVPHLLRDHFGHQVEVREAAEILGEFKIPVSFTPDLFILEALTMQTLSHLQMVRVLAQTGKIGRAHV